jgi:hypothetical protein
MIVVRQPVSVNVNANISYSSNIVVTQGSNVSVVATQGGSYSAASIIIS